MHNTPLRTLLSALLLLTAPLSSAGPLRDKLQEWRAERQAPHAQIQRDLAYSSDKQQRLDLYLPTNAQQAPVLLMVHGGSWRLGDKGAAAVVDNKVKRWLPKGFIFVSINYRLLPAAAPLEQADDVARALAFVQQQASGWGGDPRKIILIGHSAGAHLVSLLAARPQRAYDLGAKAWLGSVALDSASMDVEQIMQGAHARFYDQAFGASPAYWAATSPLRQLDKTATPLLAVCSSQRSDSCPAARKFVAAASRLGVNAQLLSQDRSHKAINQDLGADNA
ncbi:MAG: alpha/beta hydrolase, partial [Pseudomonas sp.]|nr:alpha/beta hydrolase [Pseudomonas sp.]